MDEQQILGRVHELVAEEKQLRDQAQALSADDRGRLSDLEQELDQCWDVLRQRRARREFGEDEDEARSRPTSQVEGYLQ